MTRHYEIIRILVRPISVLTWFHEATTKKAQLELQYSNTPINNFRQNFNLCFKNLFSLLLKEELSKVHLGVLALVRYISITKA